MRTDGRSGRAIRPGGLISATVQIVVIAGLVGIVAGYFLVPSWRDAVNGLVGSIADVVRPPADPVSTAGAATGDALKDHPAQNAFDGSTAYWAAPFVDGKPPAIAATFAPPADVTKVQIFSGAPGDKFMALARPRDVTLEFLDAGGTVTVSKSYELKETADPQTFDVGARGAASVRVTVRSVYVATTAGAPVAITEIKFYGRRVEAPSTTPNP